MARNRIGLEIDLESMITGLEKAGANVKDSVNSVQKASKKVVTDCLVRDTIKSNFPAKGKYSTGCLVKSIDKDYSVKWQGYIAEVKVGYDFKKSGMESIMLMYGTPRMKKAQKLYNDIYGSRVRKEIEEIQQEALNKILERAVSNGGR